MLGMSDTCMDRRRPTGGLLRTLLWWTLIGLCCASHRPFSRGERTRYTRHHDRWTQRTEDPSLHDQGTQRIEYPSLNDDSQGVDYASVHDRGQEGLYPSVNESGASSQIKKCSPGYYRDGSGPYLGRCVPCKCNGLADECEEKTGRCLNCQYNTAGDRCERCKEGYYGNAAQRTCTVCPCPLSVPTNSFAVGCREVFGDLQCKCRAGYTGDRCERCAPGYYGHPLVLGGTCKPCNCNGNSNNCDPRTGVCKNTLEPGDTNTDEHCQECDNCAQTLIHDLEKLDDELARIKAQMDNATASASSKDKLKKLEEAVSDVKTLIKKFSLTINTLKSGVNQLDEDMAALSDDIRSLKSKAGKRAADADKAVEDVNKTHKRAKDLDREIQNMLNKIQALLDQLKGAGGDKPNENLAQMLEDAQRMVDEMESRNFTPQKTAAERELDKAKKLLDYIKTNISNQYDQNENAAKKIQGLLKGYEAKLKDLDKALKEAVDLLKKANVLNERNTQELVDMQKLIENLKKQRTTVEEQMAMAEKDLKKTEDFGNKLADSKTEYEQLAAQLDGAKNELTKQVNELSKAANKEDIVQKAEKHAEDLVRQAKQLEDAVKSTSGRSEVRNAKDAIDAYKNITVAIDAAEAAAGKAKAAADDALNNLKKLKLPQRAKDVKATGDDLLRRASKANDDLGDIADDLVDQKRRLNNADNKQKALEKDLLDKQRQINDINRDDIGDMINEAKNKADSANVSAANTMDKLNDIQKEIDKIRVTPVDSNLANVLDDVDKSVNNLLKTIPTLDDKISEVENLTSQVSSFTNITENIKKIKELIELARDAANRIGIPMKFTGEGHVEMRPPKDLDELKAYTSLSLSLQRPEEGRGDGRRRRRQATSKGDMFVMYLGNRDSSKNYIGMVLRNNVLYGVYKLNGLEHEIRTGSITISPSEPASFDKVDLERIYQDVAMDLIQDYTSGKPTTEIQSNITGEEGKNLLDLNLSDFVFYVGGYPKNFTPPASLNYPRYRGCIEFNSVNEKIASLYNFQKAEKINLETPCKRYVFPKESYYYEGTGYSKVAVSRPVSVISLFISTHSENGLLLYAGNGDKYFTVTIEQGSIFLRSNLFNQHFKQDHKAFPKTIFTEILIVVSSQGISIRFDNKVMKTGAPPTKMEFKEFYIGGAPQDLRERDNITIQPFKGCMKNLKVNRVNERFTEEVGIRKGCPESLIIRKAEFSLKSSLSADLKDFSLAKDVTVSLGFKSTENQGVILQNKKQNNGMTIALENGYVVLSFNNKMWKSTKQYHDGQWHYLTVTKIAGRIELLIDDEDKGEEKSGSTSISDTSGVMFLGNQDFKGCISNLYTRRPANLFKAEDLSTFVASGNVLLDVCTANSPAQLMLDRNSRKR